jgi:hypothetical protein
VGYIFNIVARDDKAAEQQKFPSPGSKILNKASGVVKAFLDRDDVGGNGLMQARALTRAVQYAQANDRLGDVQIWDPQKGVG